MEGRMAKHAKWTQADVPDQTGKVAVVTGANVGIGLELAKALALRGARVLFCCRDLQRGRAALDAMPRDASSKCDLIHLDLASLASVREAASRIRENHAQIHVLINNAGVMWHPRDKTADGFEVHLGVNHLGHFALTGLLMERLLVTENSRVVTLTGLAYAHYPIIQFDDLQLEDAYTPQAAYAQSKLANLLFAYRLQARLSRASAPTISLAAHPGAVQTDLLRHAALWMRVASALVGRFFSQVPAMGALPALRAATDPHVRGGHFYGPDGAREFRGYPVEVLSNEASHDVEMQRRLWDESERLTGVRFPI
jgi:NAD(P)-dependent dehydrogenase (short-subunit alcohol dehydrogenase family)